MDEREHPGQGSTDDPHRRHSGDDDLLHGGSGEQGSPDGSTVSDPIDDPLNGGSGENRPTDANEPGENEPPIKRHDGQVYGG
jgi:hypothetical protein